MISSAVATVEAEWLTLQCRNRITWDVNVKRTKGHNVAIEKFRVWRKHGFSTLAARWGEQQALVWGALACGAIV